MRLLVVLSAMVMVAARSLLAQTLDARIATYVQARPGAPFSGVITVERGGRVVFNRAFGFADADLGVANHPDLRFGIGSLSKPITATAALRLVERGRLHLDDDICRYLRQCPPAWRAVTIEHLLSHTSEYRISSVSCPRLRSTRREPSYNDVRRVMPRRVRRYASVRDSLRLTPYHDHSAYAAGGLLSSSRDLLRFNAALVDGRLLADSTLRAMSTVRKGDYALGWQIIQAFGKRLRNHAGGTNGFASWLGAFDDGTVIVILSNVEDTPAKSIGCDVAAITFGLKPSPSAGPACRANP